MPKAERAARKAWGFIGEPAQTPSARFEKCNRKVARQSSATRDWT
jgi:hypothetical protein